MIRKEQLYEQILEQIDLTKETDDEADSHSIG